MTWTFQSLQLFVLSCLLFAFETSQVLPPQNVSLRWKTDFEPQLSWEPPKHSADDCTYQVERSTTNKEEDKVTFNPSSELSWSTYTVMNGRYLYLSVKAICNNTHSEQVAKPTTYPELVRNLSCYVHSSKQTRCSWLPVSDAADLGFFFRLTAEDLSLSIHNISRTPLRGCPAYVNRKTGCDLQADTRHSIHILFNGTLNNSSVRNTFKIWLKENARPLPLNWTVIKAGDTFNISWIPPDFDKLSVWKFTIKQTACNKSMLHDVFEGTSTELNVIRRCENCMAIKAVRKVTGGESEWSDVKCFGSEPNALVYAAIIIPMMFAVLAALTLMCCKKNKDIIFPRVPEPRDFLSDISDNNNKITVRNLYIPAEEEDCKITLVIDPLNNKLIS
ncbi:uncharacterized protein LOC115589910 [Sparus aurata]|uniref:Uncharacterized LOC115589910 n=1 Tax=Sparus aurata TaxID=8175 RepID=A0A671UU71_SPAAU|nr:uncharacterized protein LOC115589910 [Sparus aurata]